MEQAAEREGPANVKSETDTVKESKPPLATEPAVGSWDHFIQYQQKRMADAVLRARGMQA